MYPFSIGNFSGQDKLKDSRMNGCFTLMLGYENAPTIEWDAAKIVGSPIGWIAVNSSKPGRPMGFSLVVQTSNKWAEAHLEVSAQSPGDGAWD